MFDPRDLLRQRLRLVTRTLRGVRVWWSLALIVIGASLLARLAMEPVRSGQLDGSMVAASLLAAVAAALVAVVIIVRRSFRDQREIAIRIEEHFPSLQQRLLTVVALISEPTASPLNYLQRRVLEEAGAHARSHSWTAVVPATHVWMSRVVGLIAMAAMAVALGILATTKPSQGLLPARSSVPSEKIVIEPGNTEIERGESLIVTARFDPRFDLGDDVELLCLSEDGSERRLAMTATLDDPILGAFVPAVDQPLRYQVVSPRYQSDVFRIDVFEYPNLVRADASLEFPGYTGLENKRIEDTLRITAVEGTKVVWELNLNHPVESAVLVDASGERRVLSVASSLPTRYLVGLQLVQSEVWKLELVDAAGRQNKYPLELSARVLVNQPPTLKQVVGGDAAVSPLEEYPVAVSVSDDFGMPRFGITYQLADGAAVEVVLGEAIPRGRAVRGDHLIDFESLNAKTDQLLTYHFWAEDFAPDGSTRRVQGDLHFAEVRPFEEIYREDQSAEAGMRAGQPPPSGGGNGQQAEELAELQKQIINATWKLIRREVAVTLSAEFSRDVDAVVEAQQDAVNRVEELGSRVQDEQSVQFVERAEQGMRTAAESLQQAVRDGSVQPLSVALQNQQVAYQALLGLRAREFQVSRANQPAASSSSSASQQRRQQQLQQLELKNDENRYETQSKALAEEALQAAGQQREVIDRLRELAQRQEDINQQIAQLQSALELAQSAEQRAEAQRQLKRLRDQQQDLLRDADALAEQMQQSEAQSQQPSPAQQQPSSSDPAGQQPSPGQSPSQPTGEGQQQPADQPTSADQQSASEKLEQTRENIRRASEALSQQDASEALTAGTRAERELDELREDLREQSAGSFDEAMRQIRNSARELDEQQQQIAQQMSGNAPSSGQATGPGLRPQEPTSDLSEDLREQQQRLRDLLDQVQETVQQAETSEPLLAQNLYETFRTAQQQKVERKLGDTAELMRRGFQPQAEQLRGEADREITRIRENLEKAAESVLGDETRALQRALGELEDLQRQLDQEIEGAAGRPASSPSRPEGPTESENATGSPTEETSEETPNRPGGDVNRERGPGSETPGVVDPSEQGARQQPAQTASPATGPTPEETPQSRPGETPGRNGRPGSQPQGGPPSGASPGELGQRLTDRSAEPPSAAASSPGGGAGFSSPLTGEGYRQWSDRLRDVEQMVGDPRLRSEANRIRERARETRSKLRRNSKQPQWDGIEEQIAKPLRELTRSVAEELLRRSADRHAIVPIDRDPVPERYSEAVRRYYESLGSGQ